MATFDTTNEELLRREICKAADATLFAGLSVGEELHEQIRARAGRGAGRSYLRNRNWWAAGSVAAAVALTLLLHRVPPAPSGLPPGAASPAPAEAPSAPYSLDPKREFNPADGRRLEDVQPTAPEPAQKIPNGPARIPFGIDVQPTGGTTPVAGAMPDFLADWTAVMVQPGAKLPVHLTWHANGSGKYAVDPAQSTWEIVSPGGERQRQPLALPTGEQPFKFDGAAPLSLDTTVQAPDKPGWYRLFLSAGASDAARAPVQGAAAQLQLFVAYPPGTLRTGEVAPAGAAVTKDGITLQIERVRMTDMITEVDYRITVPSDVRAPAGHNTFLAWDGGEWTDPVTVGEREGPREADGSVRYVTGQAIFLPTPRTAGRLQLRIPSLHVTVPTGGPYGSAQTREGPWVVSVDLPAQR